MTAQDIYNTFLSISRGSQNKPWKPRKNFENFEKTENGILCTRLELFFKRFPQINPREFFSAPYTLYKDEDHFELKFYLSQKAISCYTLVLKQKQEELPDTDNQIQSLIQSVSFIANKLLTRKVSFVTYYNTKNGYVFEPVTDYAEGNISLYFFLALPNFDTIFDSMPQQDKEIYCKSFYKEVVKFKTRLNNSVKARKIITESHKRLNQLEQS